MTLLLSLVSRCARASGSLLIAALAVASVPVAFFVYSAFRTSLEYCGFSIVRSLLILSVISIFTLPGAFIAIEVIGQLRWVRDEWVPFMRSRNALCVGCSYPVDALRVESATCPECGESNGAWIGVVPSNSKWVKARRKRWVFLSVLLSLGISAIGGFAGEANVLIDEARFRHEVEVFHASSDARMYARSRAWPNETGSLVYLRGRGIHATD